MIKGLPFPENIPPEETSFNRQEVSQLSLALLVDKSSISRQELVQLIKLPLVINITVDKTSISCQMLLLSIECPLFVDRDSINQVVCCYHRGGALGEFFYVTPFTSLKKLYMTVSNLQFFMVFSKGYSIISQGALTEILMDFA